MNFASLVRHDNPVYQALLLGGACAIVSLALIAGYSMTWETIQQEEMLDQLNSLNQVMDAELYDNNPLDKVEYLPDDRLLAPAELLIARKADVVTATAMQVEIAGWGGPLDMLVATNPAGEILGVRVIRHKETPGLADKIEIAKSQWITGFNGHSLANTTDQQWAVKKDNGIFDQFTGATITPRAVVKGVKTALDVQARWQASQQPAAQN
ncbi:RnfABCDGE type electron transport complex subunit G [Oceanobacter mangrovi]|uniref:RnfABCDGE type electron transport complex subunit G n=1 Tax=Oceanobacter mangrovi TaxID=2862510 RepID=UPI001C8EB8EE|nr:RnfABCDGE type electron transport complex subunit G [Oceanobacter mangrovi]